MPPPMTPSHAPTSSFIKKSPSNASTTSPLSTPQSLIHTHFPAHILVASTPSVDNTLSLNSLTLPQLLTPFRHHKHLYTRTLSHSYEMTGDWDLRFAGFEEMRGGGGVMERVWGGYLGRVVRGVSVEDDDEGSSMNSQYESKSSKASSAEGVSSHVARPTIIAPPPSQYHHTKQFTIFRSEFLTHATEISDASTLRHPVGIMYAISSHDDTIEDVLRLDQRVAQALERRYNMDLDVCKYYVLFYDEHRERMLQEKNTTKSRDPHVLFELMKKRFGAQSCKLVHINTRRHDEPPVSDIWTPHMSRYEQYVRGDANTHIQTPLSASNVLERDTPPRSFSGGKYDDKKRASQRVQDVGAPQENVPQEDAAAAPPLGESSAQEESPEDSTNPPSSPNTTPVGQYLSLRDIQNLEQLIDDMVRNGILPAMQLKIENIHNNVAGKYGGKLKNIAKYFGFGATRRKAAEEQFGADSPEMQIIRLADYMFLLRDYHAALHNYLKLRDDLKPHKKLYASINEGVALSTLMYSGATREAEQAIQIAYESYLECGEYKYAMRAAFFRAMIFELREQYQLAAESYVAASQIFNDNLYRAILYEQSALCFEACHPPLVRKFIFFNCCASYNYSNANAMQLAFQCHQAALRMAQQGQYVTMWPNVRQMMNLTMARLEMHRGRVKEALQYYHLCLAQPTTVIAELDQNQLLEEWRNAVLVYQRQEAQGDTTESKKSPPLPIHFEDLQTPHIVNNSVRIFLSNYGEWDAIGAGVPFDDKWNLMEEDAVRFIHKRVPFSRHNVGKENVCSVGRPIRFEIQISNPLAVPLDVTNLSPAWTFSPTSSSSDDDSSAPNSDDDITTHPISIQLPPHTQQTIVLNMVAHRKGKLVIRGVKWTLGGVAEGRIRFRLRGKRLNTTKQQRASMEYEKDSRLHVNIVNPVPRISLTQRRELPTTLLNGQITRHVITIRNESKVALKNLCVKCNLPQVMCFGVASEGERIRSDSNNHVTEDNTVALRQCDIVHTESEGAHAGESKTSHSHSRDLSIYRLDLGPTKELGPEESVNLVLFLRGSACGTYDLRMLFVYEPAKSHKHILYRLHQWRQSLAVEPSLLLHTYTQPSVEDVSKFSLTLTVTNSTSLHTINLQQVTSYSKDWILRPISVGGGQCEISPNEGVVLHFSIERRREDGNVSDADTANLTQTTVAISSPIQDAVDCFDSVHWDLLRRNILDAIHRGTASLSTSFDDGSFSMLMLWNLKGSPESTHGQLDIPQLYFQPSQSKTTTGPPFPLQIVLEYDQEMEAFKGDNTHMHLLPVSIHIMNDSASTATSSCVLELLHDETSTATDYVWMGCRKRKFDIKPGQTVSLFTQACFFRPGVYNLNRFRVEYLQGQYARFEGHQYLCRIKGE